MRLLYPVAAFLLLCAAAATGCSSDSLEEMAGPAVVVPCDTAAVATFSGVVRPVLERNYCLSCHVTGGDVNAVARYNYETSAGLKAAVDAGRLLGAIEHRSGFQPMPKSPVGYQMSACDVAIIKQWIRRGMPND